MAEERRVWYLRAGPCRCGGGSGATGDVFTWRRRTVAAPGLDADLLIATDRIPAYLAEEVRQATHSSRWLVVTQPLCPRVAWDPAPGTLVEVASLVTIDGALDACVNDQPELLALAMASVIRRDAPRLALT
jgi:hypothetical protein